MQKSQVRVTAAIVVGAALLVGASATRADAQTNIFPSHPSTFVSSADLDADGDVDSIRTVTFTYEKYVTKAVIVIDGSLMPPNPPNGVPDQIQTQTTTLAKNGNQLRDEVAIDFGGNGTIEQNRVIDYTYDQRGNVTLITNVVTNAVTNALLLSQTTTNTWDNRSNLLHQHILFDFPAPGVDRIQDQTNVFNNQGDLIQSTFELDEDADGTVDIENFTTLQRGPGGRPIFQETQIDNPFDGAIDETRTFSNFQFHGNDVVGFETERTVAPSTLVWRNTTTLTFDKPGQLTEQRTEVDLGGNGTVDNTLVNTFTFDKKGNPLTQHIETDVDSDGDTEQIVNNVFTY